MGTVVYLKHHQISILYSRTSQTSNGYAMGNSMCLFCSAYVCCLCVCAPLQDTFYIYTTFAQCTMSNVLAVWSAHLISYQHCVFGCVLW